MTKDNDMTKATMFNFDLAMTKKPQKANEIEEDNEIQLDDDYETSTENENEDELLDIDIDLDIDTSFNTNIYEDINITDEDIKLSDGTELSVEPTDDAELETDDIKLESEPDTDDSYDEIELEVEDTPSDIDKVSLDIGRMSIYLRDSEGISDADLDDLDDEIELELEPETTNTASTGTYINQYKRKRGNVPIEKSVASVNSYLSLARSELQAYINNIHSSFGLNRSTPDINDIRLIENIDKEYFAVLSNIYRDKYKRNRAEGKRDFTPEQFITMDIYEYLEPYIDTGNSDLKKVLSDRKHITPSELLANESLLIQLLDMLKRTHNALNESEANEKKNKSDLELINNNILRKNIQQPIKPISSSDGETTFNCAYPKSISVSATGETFECGNCGETVKADRPFYTFGFLPFQGVSENRNYQYEVITIPGINKCPHCGYRNILSEGELNTLARTDKSKHRDVLLTFAEPSRQLCYGFNLTKYYNNAQFLSETLPYLYNDTTEDEQTSSVDVNDIDDNVIDNDVSGALQRYRDLLDFFRGQIDLSSKPITNDSPSTVTIQNIDSVITNTDISKNVEILESSGGVYNLSIITKLICGCVGVDYEDVKTNAINALNTYIINSPLYPILSYSSVELSGIVAKSKNIVNYIDELSDSELDSLIPPLAGFCSYPIGKILDKNNGDKVIKANLPAFLEALGEYFEKLEKMSKKSKNLRKATIDEMFRNIRLYSYVPIVRIPTLNTAKINELLYYKDYCNFVEQASNLMILNKYIERFFRFWKGLIPNDSVSSINNLSDINKDNNISYCEKLCSSLEILSFAPGTKKVVKQRILTNIFSEVRMIDYDEITKLDYVQKAFIDKDEFNLMNAIADCKFIEDKYLDGYLYDTPVFKPICEVLRELYPTALSFVNKYGRTPIDRICYYLDGIFTRDEIENGYEGIYSKTRFTYIIQREDNENLKSYLERLSHVTAHNNSNEERVRSKHEVFDSCINHSAALSACDLPSVYYTSNVTNISVFITLMDLIHYILQKDLGSILNILKLDSQFSSKIANTNNIAVKSLSKKRKDAKMYLLRSIYLNNDYNLVGDLSSLVDDEELGVESAIDIDTNDDERIEILLSDIEKFNEVSKHLPQEVIDTINEFYPIRR